MLFGELAWNRVDFLSLVLFGFLSDSFVFSGRRFWVGGNLVLFGGLAYLFVFVLRELDVLVWRVSF